MAFLSVAASEKLRSDETNFVPASYTGKPFAGAPVSIPGVIQAEAYDIAPGGAKDVSFNYKGDPKQTSYRPGPDSIGLAQFGKGHVSITGEAEAPDQIYVGWTETGEWLKYTVHVTETGDYLLGGKFAAGDKGAQISVTFSPDIKTGAFEIPTTAGYQPGVEVYHVWEKLDNLAVVHLPAGVYVMTVKIESGAGLNFDYFTLKKKS
jgi:hypothetical protein